MGSCFKAVLHWTACKNDFLRNNVAQKIEHRVTWYRGRFLAHHLTRQHVAFVFEPKSKTRNAR